MKFATFLLNGKPRLGVVDGDCVVDLSEAVPEVAPDLCEVIRSNVDLRSLGESVIKKSESSRIPLSDVKFGPLLINPGKVVCLGLNYFDHAKESGREKPDYPWFFFRAKTSLMGHGQPGYVPKVSSKVDYEAELGVLIGETVPRHVSQENALKYVVGYTCFNDISIRDYQKRTPQWTIGKNFDGTGGLGPWMVLADELPEGGEGLKIQCRLNGEIMQNANTSDMIWSVAETISLLSDCLTLEPGDVIAMGTPSGVGQSRDPQVWMKAGDTVEVEIESIGVLRNPIVAEGD